MSQDTLTLSMPDGYTAEVTVTYEYHDTRVRSHGPRSEIYIDCVDWDGEDITDELTSEQMESLEDGIRELHE